MNFEKWNNRAVEDKKGISNMLMHYYGVHGYGLYLNDQEYKRFADAYATTKNIEFGDVAIELDGVSLDDDTFDGREVWHLDEKPHEEDGDDFVDGFFLFSTCQGSVLSSSRHCYPDIATMASEFKTEYGTYLPKDFDYEAHLACLTGAQYC